jgi:hypothetical protein
MAPRLIITYDASTSGPQVPVADAGPDQTVADFDGDGSQNVTLDGSGSSDSDGTIVSYSWREGEVEIATVESPSLDLSVGVHNLTLIVVDNDGSTDFDMVSITVTANAAPTADAGPDQDLVDNDGIGIETVELDGSASSDSDGTIVSYSWQEASVEIATGETPSLDLTVGTHDLTLVVTDDGGATGSDDVTILVGEQGSVNLPPVANAGPDQILSDNDGTGSENVTLDGSASSDSDGTIVSYSWREGGLEIATGVNPSLNLAVGVHNLTLIVTDDGGETASDAVSISITANIAPTASAGPDQNRTDTDGSGSESVTLNGGGSSDSDGTIVSYSWQAGGVVIATGASPSVDLAVGVHNLNLIVTDNGGATASDSVQITIVPGGQGVLTVQVQNSSDDVNESGASFQPQLGSVWIGTRDNPAASFTGLRFTGVNIPQGSTIISASLELHASSNQWLTIGANIAGDASDNSATFSDSDRPSGRPLTSTTIVHSSNAQSVANTWYTLDDVASVVQEIVNRPGWQPGNSLALVMQGTGGAWGSKFAYSYDGGPLLAPRLVITFDASTSGPQAPVANAGPDQSLSDNDGGGSQPVTLDGSGSSDSDGTIVSYSWQEAGV